MPFPEFDPARKKILFFSRGRGRGHAVPDLEIVRKLHEMRQDVDVRFVSYATGAKAIAEAGIPLIDVGLPMDGALAEMSAIAGRLIMWLRPDLVVSHEEFAALPAAKIFDRAAICITDWFAEEDQFSMHALKFADEILFTGSAGIFAEPPWVNGKVAYVGPVLREFRYGRKDRDRARRELKLPEDATVVTVFPGSWTEERAPILDLVVEAFDLLDAPDKRVVWLAGEDYELLSERLRDRTDAVVLRTEPAIDRLMAASDIAITKCNRMTLAELCSLGVPTLALTHGLNSIDDRIIASLAGAELKHVQQTSAAELSDQIQRALQAEHSTGNFIKSSAHECASRISRTLDIAIGAGTM